MSGENGNYAAHEGDKRSASVGSLFAQDYALQRERRTAALAGVLAADAAPASSATCVSASGDGSTSREECWRDLTRQVLPSGLPGLEPLMLLWHAQLALSLGGFRQWHKQIQLAADYWVALLGVFASSNCYAAGSQAEQNRAVNETRAYLRRISDLSLQEARVVQLELERIGDGMRELIADPRPDAADIARRWRAKR
jgi:hypothetical protein